MAAHPIVHIELSATDPAAAAKFYSEVFDWKIEHDPNFDYYQFKPDSGPAGGYVKPDGKMYNKGDVVIYIQTDDIEATLKKIEAKGGKTTLPKQEIPGIGWFAFFTDPVGNRVALYKSLHPQS